MNYLAHAYLSFNDPGILTGNMISDFVKGRKKFDYSPRIQQGITLHRVIDEYTDSHPATKKAKEVFRPAYRLYAGAFADVAFDHFLAISKTEFIPEGIFAFSQWVYEQLDKQTNVFPPAFARMYPYMRLQNWLYYYHTEEGIQKSFGGLVRRSKYLEDSTEANVVFRENYALLQECFTELWKDLLPFTRTVFETMEE